MVSNIKLDGEVGEDACDVGVVSTTLEACHYTQNTIKAWYLARKHCARLWCVFRVDTGSIWGHMVSSKKLDGEVGEDAC